MLILKLKVEIKLKLKSICISQDPVNGSSHTNLAPMWAVGLGKKGQLRARVLSQRGRENRIFHNVEKWLQVKVFVLDFFRSVNR